MSVFYKPTPYNGCTKNQMWMSCIADSHDIHCGCEQPFAHLLDSIFPKDHKDRHLTIDQDKLKETKNLCLSGGIEDEDHGNGRWYQRRNRKYKKRRFRKRRRRWPRRTARRRRRARRKKVRRKKQKLFLQQWQPDTIRKCKIKGTGIHIIGGNGAQFNCFTPNRFNWTPPLMPGGGGFGVETYSLQHLYNEHKLQNNIWTQSNKNLELVRYTGCWFKFYRHETIDFIVQYSRQLPMSLEKYTYPDSHPNSLLHAKHKK